MYDSTCDRCIGIKMGINIIFSTLKCLCTLAKRQSNLQSGCLQMFMSVNTVVDSLPKWKTSDVGNVNITRESTTMYWRNGHVVERRIDVQPLIIVPMVI